MYLSRVINSPLRAFHLLVLSWRRDNDKENKGEIKRDGQRKQQSSSGLGLLWSEHGGEMCMCVFVSLCAGVAGWWEKSRTAACAFPNSVRPDWHFNKGCWIPLLHPAGEAKHTHSHIFGHMHTKYTGESYVGVCVCVHAGVHRCVYFKDIKAHWWMCSRYEITSKVNL